MCNRSIKKDRHVFDKCKVGRPTKDNTNQQPHPADRRLFERQLFKCNVDKATNNLTKYTHLSVVLENHSYKILMILKQIIDSISRFYQSPVGFITIISNPIVTLEMRISLMFTGHELNTIVISM